MSQGAWTERGPGPIGGAPKRGWASWSTGQRVLLVLGLLVGGGFALLIASVIAGYVWMTGNGDQIPAEAVVREGAHAYVAMHPASDDPGVNALLKRIEAKLREVGNRGQGSAGQGLQQFQALVRQTSGIEQLFPRELWVGFEPGEGGVMRYAIAMNTRAMGNSVRLVVWFVARLAEQEAQASGDAPTQVLDHRGHRVLLLGDVALALHGTTVVVSSELDTVKGVLDRVDDAPKAALLPVRFGGLRNDLSRGTDAHVVVESPSEHFAGLAGGGGSEDANPFVQIALVTMTMDLVTDDELRGVVSVTCREGGDLDLMKKMVESAAEGAVERARTAGLVLTVSTGVDGQKVNATYRMTGIAAKIEAVIEESAAANARGEAPEVPAAGAEPEGSEP